MEARHAVQAVTVDRAGFLALHAATSGEMLASKRVSTQPVVGLLHAPAAAAQPGLYAVVAEDRVTLWRVERDVEYNVVRGGHAGAVVALYACSDGLVRFASVLLLLGNVKCRPFGATHASDDALRILRRCVLRKMLRTRGMCHAASTLCEQEAPAPGVNVLEWLQGQVIGEEDHRVFSASADGTLRLWDPAGLSCLCVYSAADGVSTGVSTGASAGASTGGGSALSEVSAATFCEPWNVLCSGHEGGEVALWDVATGGHRVLHHHGNTVSCMEMAFLLVRVAHSVCCAPCCAVILFMLCLEHAPLLSTALVAVINLRVTCNPSPNHTGCALRCKRWRP
jgi:hypothetical protein